MTLFRKNFFDFRQSASKAERFA